MDNNHNIYSPQPADNTPATSGDCVGQPERSEITPGQYSRTPSSSATPDGCVTWSSDGTYRQTAQSSRQFTPPYQTPQQPGFAEEYYYTDPAQKPHRFPEEKKPAKKVIISASKPALAAAAVIMLVAAFGLGYLGGYLAVSDSSGSGKETGQPDSTTVMYQSVGGMTSTGEVYMTSNVAANTLDSVVEITTESVTYNTFMGQYVTEGAGSGVIVTSDGYIVTNNHVIEGASKITVTLSDGEEYKAELIAADERTDLAVIKIDCDSVTPAVFGTSADLCVGEPVIAIGNPLGELGGTVTSGIISALDREITIGGEKMVLLQTDASVSPGNSGGGLFNSKGELVGIVNAKSSGDDAEGLGFAIPSDTAKDVIEQLIAFGYVQGRVYIGMSLVDINDRYTASAYRVNEYGVYVLSVDEGGAAEAAGLESGDRLIAIDDIEFSTSAELSALLDDYSVGDTVVFSVSRNRKHIKIELTLGEYTGGR